VLTDAQQVVRRNAIVRILRDGLVRKQEDLVHMLKREGHEVTQSSISRDLRDLGVLKASGRYVLPPDEIGRAQGDSGIDIGASARPPAEELPAASSSGFQGLAGPRGTADDLKKLPGVSGAIEKKFNDLGIFHFWQLAELDHDTAHKIGEELGLPSRADAWVAKAKALTAEAE